MNSFAEQGIFAVEHGEAFVPDKNLYKKCSAIYNFANSFQTESEGSEQNAEHDLGAYSKKTKYRGSVHLHPLYSA